MGFAIIPKDTHYFLYVEHKKSIVELIIGGASGYYKLFDGKKTYDMIDTERYLKNKTVIILESFLE